MNSSERRCVNQSNQRAAVVMSRPFIHSLMGESAWKRQIDELPATSGCASKDGHSTHYNGDDPPFEQTSRSQIHTNNAVGFS